MQAGGQYQIVIGDNVPTVYAELGQITKLTGDTQTDEEPAPHGNLFNRFIDLISSIFSPIIWPLAAAGLLKAFLSMATQFGWLDPASQTNVILAATADALLYFLPIFLAVSASKRFKTNQFTSMAIAGALVYPSIVALAAQTEPVSFVGIPVVMMTTPAPSSRSSSPSGCRATWSASSTGRFRRPSATSPPRCSPS